MRLVCYFEHRLKRQHLRKDYILLLRFPLLIRTFTLFAFLLIGSYFTLYKVLFEDTKPPKNGSTFVSGINALITLSRDKNGIIYIEAETDDDVYFAMGYAHAQDRLWQLELQKRTTQGRLSEVLGEGAVSRDIWIRTLGIREAAKKAEAQLSEQARKSLAAYARGINSWIGEGNNLPTEFTVLGIEPEPWTIIDSLAWVKMFALSLSSNYSAEIQKYVASQYLTKKQLGLFFKGQAKTAIEQTSGQFTSDMSDLAVLNEEFERELNIDGSFIGSNAWAIAGKHTKDGTPIIANDPHHGLQIPSMWYVVKQKGDKLNSAGMNLVGIPMVVFGRNQNIAWAGTSMMADVQDLFIERINPENPRQYFHNGEWQNFEYRTEKINIRADFPSSIRPEIEPIKVQIRSSVHGPIISDVIAGFENPVALRWTALDDMDTTYDAIFQLNYAADWESFKQALSLVVAPALNIIYADSRNIGMLGVGKIPIRTGRDGTLPVDGGKLENEWVRYLTIDEMPTFFNPPHGYIINANNDNRPSQYPYFISHDFAPPYRANRISQMLDAKIENEEIISIEYVKDMQSDHLDIATTKILDVLTSYQPTKKEHQDVLKYLNNWNGEASRDSVGATIYYSWIRHLRNRLFNDELSTHWNSGSHKSLLSAIKNRVVPDEVYRLIMSESEWCDNIKTDTQESCEFVLSSSFEDMYEEMSKFAGSDVEYWKLGQVQHTVYKHVPFSDFKGVRDLFERKVASGGSSNTVNVAASDFDEIEGYVQRFGPAFRQIIQFTNSKVNHEFINSSGQSGIVSSPFYDNTIFSFRDGGFYQFSHKKIEQEFVIYPSNNQAGN